MELNVLYEDNHLLMVEKPINIPVQEDSSGDKDFLTMCKEYIKVNENKPGNVYLAMVHRLDRPVGGAMVFAKTSKASSRLSDQVRQKKFDREYLAVTVSQPVHPETTLTDYLYKDRKENKSYVVDKGVRDSKFAKLMYKQLATEEGYTLLSVKLDTGRSHQIRVQLAHNGTPIYGDQKYNEEESVPGQQIALWSHKLTVEHPTKKEPITVTSRPPQAEDPWLMFDLDKYLD